MRPISNEKRELIIEARERGEKIETIARWVQVSESSVKNIIRLNKEKGTVSPKPYKGRKPKISNEQIASIEQMIRDKPDATLEEIIDELDLPIKKSRLSVILIRMKLPLKKNTFSNRAKA